MKNSVPKSKRISSLDISRGISIFLMIEAHILILIPLFSKKCAFFAAPFFLIIAGVSFQLFLQSRIKRGLKYSSIYLETFWRALLLFLITFSITILGIIFFGWYYKLIGNVGLTIYNIPWTVFEAISLGYIIGLIIYRSFKLKLLTIFVLFVISYLISFFDINSLFFLIKPSSFSMNMIAFFIFGQLIYESYNKVNISPSRNSKLIAYSIILIIVSYIILIISPYEFVYSERTKFPVFLMSSSILFFSMLILIRLRDINDKFKNILSPFEGIGKIAFSAYYLHIIIIHLLKIVLLNRMPPYIVNITILVLTVIILSIIERYWRKYNYAFGLEWILRRGANFLTNKSEKVLEKLL